MNNILDNNKTSEEIMNNELNTVTAVSPVQQSDKFKTMLISVISIISVLALIFYGMYVSTPEQKAIKFAKTFMSELSNENFLEMSQMSLNAYAGDYINEYAGVTIVNSSFKSINNSPDYLTVSRTRAEGNQFWDLEKLVFQRSWVDTGEYIMETETDDSFTIKSVNKVDQYSVSFIVDYSTFLGSTKTSTVVVKIATDVKGDLKVTDFFGIINLNL